MLINLSNHPSEKWHNNQLSEANRIFGVVIDLPFPHIPPNESPEFIKNLASSYLQKVLDIFSSSKDKKNAVHIMGELTFTYNLINLLKKENIICLASTTDRNAFENGNEKISIFDFVRFREY